jgi:hypothetical protein
MVYDTGDPRKPLQKEWFELGKRDARWTKDLDGRNENRCYSAEHVLEWQLLVDFIEEEKDTNLLGSRCVHLYEWFLEYMPKGKSHKVKVAKDKGKLGTNNRFDFEDKDYSMDGWDFTKQKNPMYITWISK